MSTWRHVVIDIGFRIVLVVLTIHEAGQYHPCQYCHSCQVGAQRLIVPGYWSMLKWIIARARIDGKFFHQVVAH